MNTVLMVAYHYPPCFGSSGLLRTLKFSRYLPGEGWQPIVLTAHPRAYAQTTPHQLAEIPASVLVKRAFALDTGRHLAIHGSSPRLLALPDRWVSWWLGAVPVGLRLIRRYRPQALWSTYPIASAHLIGLTLHRLTGIPWVADFRDSMTEDDYPRHRLTRRVYRWIERRTLARAAVVIFTAESARKMYLLRYPEIEHRRSRVIVNGYDEEDFTDLPPAPRRISGADGPLRLLHAGLIYPEERDPRPLFHALVSLKKTGTVSPKTLQLDLRASGSEDYYARLINELHIADIVQLLPPLPYRDSLQDAATADALLLLQGPSCDHQIPAKAYEYLRLDKPILALTTHEGDTGTLLETTGGATIVDPLSADAIARALPRFLDAVLTGTHSLPIPAITRGYARRSQAGELARCLSFALDTSARKTP
jgi:glycosyltransferase involved in cell wall biosynthesis